MCGEDEERLIEIPAGATPQRADKALAESIRDYSRTQIQRWFEAGRVWRGDSSLTKRDRVEPGDSIGVSIPSVRAAEPLPADIPLDVLYEDEHYIALNKSAGMVVHPGAGTRSDTLVHALLHHCRGQLSGIGGVERPGIVHRLDRETSGVIVAAKSDTAFQGLARQFVERTLVKRYCALVEGAPGLDSGVIEMPIGRHPTHRTRMAVAEKGGRGARTDWKVGERFGQLAARVDCRIHTGRTHQIRVHLAHLGHPLLGDSLYGFRSNAFAGPEIPRIMLHAWSLELKHPVSEEPMTHTAPPPGDLEALVGSLRAAGA